MDKQEAKRVMTLIERIAWMRQHCAANTINRPGLRVLLDDMEAALTQDRAAVLEEALTDAIAFVRDTTDYRCGNPAFEQMEAKLVRVLKTPPAQAEPKLCPHDWSKDNFGKTCCKLCAKRPHEVGMVEKPDGSVIAERRNPAEADRRKSDRRTK